MLTEGLLDKGCIYFVKTATISLMLKGLTILLLLSGIPACAQNIDTLQVHTPSCPEYNSLRAHADIKKGEAVLFLQGGSIVTFSNEKKLSKRYHITLINKGCIAPASKECMLAYNQVVFEHLDKTFGIGWRKEVRKDVLGFPEYHYRFD